MQITVFKKYQSIIYGGGGCIYLNDCVCWFLQVGDMLLGASYTPRPLSTNAEVALPPAPLAELVQQS